MFPRMITQRLFSDSLAPIFIKCPNCNARTLMPPADGNNERPYITSSVCWKCKRYTFRVLWVSSMKDINYGQEF